LLRVRTLYAHKPLPLSGTTQVLLACEDGTALEATSDMVSLAERLEVGCVQVAPMTVHPPDLAGFVLLGHVPEPAEVGLLEIKVADQRLISGVFFRSEAGEAGVVAAAFPVHLTWYGPGLREADGPPEYDLAAYRRAVL
jgi:hypothetical protein